MTDVVILGLGYVGLPLAQEAVRAGARCSASTWPTHRRRAQRGPVPHRRPRRRRHRRHAGRRVLRHHRCVRPRHGRHRRHLRPRPRCPPTAGRTSARCSANRGGGPHVHEGCSWCWSPPPTRARPTRSSDRCWSAIRLVAGHGLSPGVQPRADRPGQRGLRHAQHPEGRRRDTPGCSRPRRRSSTAGSSTPSCTPTAPARPRWPSCWRTPTDTSTSPSSTRWRGSATSWTSTSGTSSAARRASRSASRRSTRARASAGTASRSTRTTSRTTCAPSSATRSGSSSWPRRST